jgi:hypothetical protein
MKIVGESTNQKTDLNELSLCSLPFTMIWATTKTLMPMKILECEHTAVSELDSGLLYLLSHCCHRRKSAHKTKDSKTTNNN